jgi:hypothetical protein
MTHLKHLLTNKVFWIIFTITILGAFLRAYHFEDWMHYQLDQARDFRVVYAAMEHGPGELPLQGPRAAGSFLRLGPLLYYLEYGSALLFGNSPAGSIVVIYCLNVLAIPLFYLLVRRFFTWKIAAGLTGVFSVSLFLIVYSRFGWNPNLIPFFMMLFAYALLRINDQNNKHAGWWFVLAAAALAFIANMHFVAFITAPIIAGVYFIWTRPWIRWQYWFFGFCVFAFLNIPLIVNDVKTGGQNVQEFIDVVLDRGSDEESSHNLVDKVVKNAGLHSQYYWIILTGDQLAGLPELKGSDIQCGYDCRNGLARGVIAFLFLITGVGCWFWLYIVETDSDRKNFLRLIAVWWTVVFLVYTPLAHDIAPRFFLLNAPLMFILLGFILVAVAKENKKIAKILAVFLIGFCITSSMFFVVKYFNELSRAATDANFEITHHDRILKEKTRITLGQMETIVDWIESKYAQNNYAVFVESQPEYKRAFWERIEARGIPRDHVPEDLDPLYRQGNYFIIIRTQSDQEKYLDKYVPGLDLIEVKSFGTLTGYYYSPNPEFVTDEKKVFAPEQRDPKFSKGVQPRYLWRQVFERCTYNQKTDKCE